MRGRRLSPPSDETSRSRPDTGQTPRRSPRPCPGPLRSRSPPIARSCEERLGSRSCSWTRAIVVGSIVSGRRTASNCLAGTWSGCMAKPACKFAAASSKRPSHDRPEPNMVRTSGHSGARAKAGMTGGDEFGRFVTTMQLAARAPSAIALSGANSAARRCHARASSSWSI